MPLEAETFEPIPLIEALAIAGFDFVLIGGVAGGSYGSAYGTFDVDVAYARDAENLERLAGVLDSLDATPRGDAIDSPANGVNVAFTTRLGALDLHGDRAGGPPYRDLKAAGTRITISGMEVVVASLDHLIALKEATGRTRDKLLATEYRVLSDELRAPPRT